MSTLGYIVCLIGLFQSLIRITYKKAKALQNRLILKGFFASVQLLLISSICNRSTAQKATKVLAKKDDLDYICFVAFVFMLCVFCAIALTRSDSKEKH